MHNFIIYFNTNFIIININLIIKLKIIKLKIIKDFIHAQFINFIFSN